MGTLQVGHTVTRARVVAVVAGVSRKKPFAAKVLGTLSNPLQGCERRRLPMWSWT